MKSTTPHTRSHSTARLRRILRAIRPYALLAVIAVLAHSVFVLPRLAGLPYDYFTYVVGDSTTQLIPAMTLLENALNDGNLFWSWGYGLGGDLYSQFSYYYTTSPLFYVLYALKRLCGAAGADFATAEQWRLAFSIIKLSLCMGLMYALLKHEKHGTLLALCGAVVYGLSPWFLDNSFAFDFMTDAAVWPPLIALAYERYRERGSWVPLLVSCALCLCNSFYFGFINTVFLIVFGLVFSWEGAPAGHARKTFGTRLRTSARRFGTLALIYVGALGVSSIGFVPGVLALLGADRAQVATTFALMPSESFLSIVPEALFAKGGSYFANEVQTFAFPLAIAFACCIDYRKVDSATRRKSLLAALALVAWLVPVASSLMNGLSYPSNRWCYLVCFAVAWTFPSWMVALAEQRRITKATVAGVGVVAAVCLATRSLRTEEIGADSGYVFTGLGGSDIALVIGGLLFVVLWALLARAQERAMGGAMNAHGGNEAALSSQPTLANSEEAASKLPTAQVHATESGMANASASDAASSGAAPRAPHPRRTIRALSVSAFAVFLACELVAAPFGPYALATGFRDSNGFEQTTAYPDANDLMAGSDAIAQTYAQLQPSSGEFYRIDDEETDALVKRGTNRFSYENRSWSLGGYSTSLYNSLLTKSLNRALKFDYDVTSTSISASQYRGLDRRLFQEIAWGVGYKLNIDEATNLYGLEGAPTSPDGLRAVDEASTDAQAYPLRYASGIDLWYDAVTPQSSWSQLTYAERDAALLQTGAVSDDVASKLGLATAEPDTSTVTDAPLTSDNVTLQGATYEDGVLTVPDEATISIAVDPESARTPGEYLLTATLVEESDGGFMIDVNGNAYRSYGSSSQWSYPQTTYSACVPNNPTTITVTLTAGTYDLSDVKLQFSSYDKLDAWYAEANRVNLENLNVGANSVSGDVDAPEDGVMALSIPYDEGWTCTIDGQTAQTFTINGDMTGVAVSAGSHHLELSYRPRAFERGAAVSVVSIAIVASAAIAQTRRRKRSAAASTAHD